MAHTTESHLTGTFEARAERQLRHTKLPLVLGSAMDRLTVARGVAFDQTDLQALRSAGEAIRAHTIVNLADYLDRFADAAGARGIRVFFARDGAEAVDHITGVLRRRGVRLVAKGK